MNKQIIYKLVAHPIGGVTVSEAAEACYDISRQLGIPVELVHNDTTYTISLEAHPKG